MSDSTEWHYTDKTGQQTGPVNTDALIQLILSKEVLGSSMAWKNGMANWTPVSQIEELYRIPAAAKAAVDTQTATAASTPSTPSTPSKTPQPSKQTPAPEVPLCYSEMYGSEQSHDGIGRLSFILLRPLLYLVISIPLHFAIVIYLNSAFIGLVFILLIAILFIRLYCLRFKNIGMTPWWTLALIIPLINLPLYLMLYTCPAGYYQTRKLDLPGKILAFFFISLSILIIVLSFIFDLRSLYTTAADKAKETIDQQKNKQEKVHPQAQ